MADGRFATAVNCMDGRTQVPVFEYIRRSYSVDYVDMVTEAGPDKILGEGKSPLVESIKSRVAISVKKHGSRVIAVVSHHECAGNPVSKEMHLINLGDSIKRVSSWFQGVRVIGLWVDENWRVHEVK